MLKCEICKIDYPHDLLAPFMSSEGNKSQICGVCALAQSNEVHGTNRRHFDGEVAEDMRLRALAWRRRGNRKTKPLPDPPKGEL